MGMTGMNDGNVPVSSASKRKGRGDRGQSPEGRRKRASHACELCRVKKVKCDEQRPCSNCVRTSNLTSRWLMLGQNLECQYPGNPLLEIEYTFHVTSLPNFIGLRLLKRGWLNWKGGVLCTKSLTWPSDHL